MTFFGKYKKLSKFQSAEDIRKFFLSNGIKGKRRHCSICPIAKYLGSFVSQTIVDYRNSGKVQPYDDFPFIWLIDKLIERDLTKPMLDFICNFDDGQYPELEIE